MGEYLGIGSRSRSGLTRADFRRTSVIRDRRTRVTSIFGLDRPKVSPYTPVDHMTISILNFCQLLQTVNVGSFIVNFTSNIDIPPFTRKICVLSSSPLKDVSRTVSSSYWSLIRQQRRSIFSKRRRIFWWCCRFWSGRHVCVRRMYS